MKTVFTMLFVLSMFATAVKAEEVLPVVNEEIVSEEVVTKTVIVENEVVEEEVEVVDEN